jgi:hypothetical protein
MLKLTYLEDEDVTFQGQAARAFNTSVELSPTITGQA